MQWKCQTRRLWIRCHQHYCKVVPKSFAQIRQSCYMSGGTFAFGEDSMLSSAEAIISLGPMRRCLVIKIHKSHLIMLFMLHVFFHHFMC